MSIQNLVNVIAEFKKQLLAKTNMQLDTIVDQETVKRIFFNLMTEVKKAHDSNFPSEAARTATLNAIVLDVASEYFTKTYNIQPSKVDVLPPPINSRTEVPPVNSRTELMPVEDRIARTIPTPITEKPEDATIVETLLQNYEDIRNNDVESFQNTDQKPRELIFTDDQQIEPGNAHQLPNRLENLHDKIAEVVNDMDMKQTVRYVCISGADRNVRLYPRRSTFRTQLVEPLRNISKVKVTFVQIPMESNTNVTNQNVFNYPLDVPFPYLLLQVDELQPQYIGNNDVIRRSVAVLTYVRHCYTSNDRGFTTFYSQNEEITFPTPLSQLANLTVSITYPNGEPYTKARDNNMIQQLDMVSATSPGASEYGGLLRIMLTTWVDSNQYQVNDYIRVDGFTPTSIIQGINKLQDYLTCAQGLQVIGVDTVNEFGRIQALFVKLPGSLDDTTALWVPDPEVIQLFSQNPVIQIQDTAIWNMNLQVSIGMQVTTTSFQTAMWNPATIQG